MGGGGESLEPYSQRHGRDVNVALCQACSEGGKKTTPVRGALWQVKPGQHVITTLVTETQPWREEKKIPKRNLTSIPNFVKWLGCRHSQGGKRGRKGREGESAATFAIPATG